MRDLARVRGEIGWTPHASPWAWLGALAVVGTLAGGGRPWALWTAAGLLAGVSLSGST
jgi:hypothetical protein